MRHFSQSLILPVQKGACMQALLLIILHTTVPHWTQRNTGKTREESGKSLGTTTVHYSFTLKLSATLVQAPEKSFVIFSFTCDTLYM